MVCVGVRTIFCFGRASVLLPDESYACYGHHNAVYNSCYDFGRPDGG